MAEVDLWRDRGLIPKSPSTNLRDFFEDGGKFDERWERKLNLNYGAHLFILETVILFGG